RRIVAALFAIVRRLLALELIEEGELATGNVLYLLAEAAGILELARCRDETILLLRHGFSDTKKGSFNKLKRDANAFGNRFGNVVLLGGLLRGIFLHCFEQRDSRERSNTDYEKCGNARESHSILLDFTRIRQQRIEWLGSAMSRVDSRSFAAKVCFCL